MQIAIVGGGATGVLSALHLSRALRQQGVEIVVIEPAEVIGKGVAYTTDDPRHLLNVRVANMGAFADQPDHLLQWLKREGPARESPSRLHIVLFHAECTAPILLISDRNFLFPAQSVM